MFNVSVKYPKQKIILKNVDITFINSELTIENKTFFNAHVIAINKDLILFSGYDQLNMKYQEISCFFVN